MNVLTYFVPGAGAGITHKEIVAAGLGYAYREPMALRECTKGPEGEPAGVLLTFGPGAGSIELDNNQQRWRRIPDAGKTEAVAWVGACCVQAFAAPDFARPSLLFGHQVELAAGGEWLVPLARGCNADADTLDWHIALPTCVEYNDAGEWVNGDVIPKYIALWQTATRFWDAVMAELLAIDPDAELDDEPLELMGFGEIQSAAVFALQANYAVGPVEVSLLGLFDSNAAQRVLLALVGWLDYQEWSKKKQASDSLNSTSGSTVAAPDTVRA